MKILDNKISVTRSILFNFKVTFSLVKNRFPVHSENLIEWKSASIACFWKQIPASISMASYVYLFVGVYLVVYSIVYFLCVVHGVDIVFAPHGIVLVVFVA